MTQTISLTGCGGESIITLQTLELTDIDFDQLWSHVPEKQSSVLVYNKDELDPQLIDTECHRKYASYMETPEMSKEIKKSYMFCGADGSEKKKDLPADFQPLLEAINKATGQEHNQVVINWYEKECDYIP